LESGEGGASSGRVEKNEWELDPNTLRLRGSVWDRMEVVAAVLRVGNESGSSAREKDRGGSARESDGCV
jgi:hypothetical protein